MQSTITTKTADGKPAMAWFHHAAGKPDTCIIILHGHNSNGNRGRFITLAKWFEHHGFDVVRWNAVRDKLDDARYRVTTLTQEIAQARSIIEKYRPQYKHIILIGHSQGGIIALQLAGEGFAERLVQLMPVVDTKENVAGKLRSVGCNIDDLAKQGSAHVTYPNGETFVYEQPFFDDLLTYDTAALYSQWRGPTLLVAGTRDVNIPPAEVERGFALANDPKELITVDDAHNFSDETATMLAANIVSWLRKE